MKHPYLLLVVLLLFSCTKKELPSGSIDPDRPIVISDIMPREGKAREKVIIKGENFGTDPKAIEVYFNEKRVNIVGMRSDMIHVIAPLRADKHNKISIVHDGNTYTSDIEFTYELSVNISTIAGHPDKMGIKDGTLDEAEFYYPEFIVADDEQNIFVIKRWQEKFEDNSLRLLNIGKNTVTTIFKTNKGAGAVCKDGNVIYFPAYQGTDLFQFDPDNLWKPKTIRIKYPEGVPTSHEWKISLAMNPVDKCFYGCLFYGELVKFDLKNNTSEVLLRGIPNGDNRTYCCFDIKDPNILYMSHEARNSICTYNLKTKEYKLYAGDPTGMPGYADGKQKDAKFNNPCQICADVDGNLYVADKENHCIRQISSDGYVSTIIGMPKVSGYRDGSPDVAMLNKPTGVAVDKEKNIYIADYGNHAVRMLQIE